MQCKLSEIKTLFDWRDEDECKPTFDGRKEIENMKHKQIIVGEYVFTPCKNAFNNKTSYWVSKKDHWLAVYAFTPMSSGNLKEMTSENSLQSYIRLFDGMIEKLSK